MKPEKIKWLIWSNEHQGWWRPQQCGYTDHKELAGRYPFEEAMEICINANKHIEWEHTPDEKVPIPNEAMIPDYDDMAGTN